MSEQQLSSPQAEASVIGTFLSKPTRVGEIISELTPDYFADPVFRLLFGAIHKAYFAGTPIDPVSIAAPLANSLSAIYGQPESGVVASVQGLADDCSLSEAPLREHAAIIRRYADRRELIRLGNGIIREAEKDEMDPAAIAGRIAQRSLAIATRTVLASEIVDFGEAGRAFVNTLKFEMEAATQGIELGAKTGIRAIDEFTRGMRPGRLYVVAGEPGVGKSAIAWVAGLNHAQRQFAKSERDRMGTFILSMEMGNHDSSGRFAQNLAQVDGQNIQDGSVSTAELARIVQEWGRRKDIPLYLNYSPNLKTSEMLALVAEAVRRHNVGLLIVDHFRTFDLDKRLADTVVEDEEKARFLKEQIARAMNVAVLCLAHTRKPNSDRNQGRPHMADLRGSGQIAAHADVLSFVYRPFMYATEKEIDEGTILDTDAEIIYRKNRQGPTGTGKVFFDPAKMNIH